MSSGALEAVRILLAAKADTSLANDRGATPLHACVNAGNSAMDMAKARLRKPGLACWHNANEHARHLFSMGALLG